MRLTLGVAPCGFQRACFDFFFPEDTDVGRELLNLNHRANGTPSRIRLRRKDGSPAWVNVQRAALQTAQGETYAISATITAVDSEP